MDVIIQNLGTKKPEVIFALLIGYSTALNDARYSALTSLIFYAITCMFLKYTIYGKEIDGLFTTNISKCVKRVIFKLGGAGEM